MKRAYLFFIIAFLSAIYFTNGSPAEIADQIMVTAIGIDVGEKEDYKVTMQIFNPEGSGSDTAVDPSLTNVSLVSGEGRTVTAAVKNCYEKLGGDIFIGQNQIILFGKDVDLSKKHELFGFFLSSSEPFLNVPCAAAENTAEELLSIPLSGEITASERFPDMIASAAENGRAIYTSFIDLMDSVNSPESAVILPVFSKAEQPENSDSSGSSGGTGGSEDQQSADSEETIPYTELDLSCGAVYLGGKAESVISAEEMGTAALLLGVGDYVSCDIEYDGLPLSKTFKLSSRRVTAKISDGRIKIRFELTLSPKDSLMFSSVSEKDGSDAAAVRLIGENARTLADSLCEVSAGLLNCDDYLKRFYPEIFRKYKDDIEKLYGVVDIDIYINQLS